MAAAKVLKPISEATMAGPSRTSQHLLSLLQEDDRSLQEHALRKLYHSIDVHWAEASELVSHIEALAEDPSFSAKDLAAAVASKCYYHLESYDNALRLALSAGSYFDVNARTEYVETIIARCIDEYTRSRVESLTNAPETAPTVDAQLEDVVNRMFARCWADGAYRAALGVALESQRLDVIEGTLKRAVQAGARVPSSSVRTTASGSPVASQDASGAGAAAGAGGGSAGSASASVDYLTHGYELACSSAIVPARTFRQKVLHVLVKLHNELSNEDNRDYSALCVCLQALGDAKAVADVLVQLLRKGVAANAAKWANDPAVLLAMQICFDVVDAENQDFAVRLYQALPAGPQSPPAGAGAGSNAAAGADMAVEGGEAPSAFDDALARIKSILDGSIPCALALDFLSSTNKCDHVLLQAIKKSVDPKNSVLHGAVVTTHGLMNAGTTHMGWLNSQLEWLRKAANWSRFSAVVSAGVVHRGHLANAMHVLQAYLPRNGAPTGSTDSPYAEGGGYYALGLIHAGRGASATAGIHARPSAVVAGAGAPEPSPTANGAAGGVINYLTEALNNTMDETVQHGACLGLGLAALGTGTDSLYSAVRNVLLSDKAVAGEAAGLAIGLLLLGHGPAWKSEMTGELAASEMLGHAHATQHEKIVRGIAVGLALMCYGLEEAADPLIRQLVEDKDSVLRYGGMYAIGLAYSGTANNAALKRLLHVAVSDVSDDVRRAAVLCIGFVLARQPTEVPLVVGHLAESYNPHVRYGAALALGIACAGTGLPEAISLLEPLMVDQTDYVRQGAFMALGLVLQCEGEAHLPRLKVIKDRLLGVVQAKGESTMSKLGAILGLGLVDAGGRNCTASIISRGGFQKAASVVGLAVFTQYWYWYPLIHFISLSLTPSALLGLTGELEFPAGTSAFAPDCACPPSWFRYPEPMAEKKEDKKAAMTTVELSTAAKARARAKAKEGTAGGDKMDVEGEQKGETKEKGKESAAAPAPAAAVAEGAPAEAKADKPKEKKEKEADSYTLVNPCRVSPGQAKFVQLPSSTSGQRYVPLSREASRAGGVVMLQDTRPHEPAPEAPVEGEAAPAPAAGASTEGGVVSAVSGALSDAVSSVTTSVTSAVTATLRAIRAPTTGQAEEKEATAPRTFEWTQGDYFPGSA